MRKMAIGEGLPLPAGCRNGSRLVIGGYGGFWQRNSRSIICSGSFRIREYIWVQEVRRWSSGGPMRQGARPRGGAPHPREHLPWLLTWGPSPSGSFPSKNNFSRRFYSVWTPFDILFLRNTEIGKKTAIRAGPPVSRLVLKMI